MMRPFGPVHTIAVIALFLSCFAVRPDGQAIARSATEHFLMDHNRVFVELEFGRPDGKPRAALAGVDNGDPNFEFTSALVKELGLEKGNSVRVRFGGMDFEHRPRN